jgi:Planctomycete cytochrome C
MPLLRKRFEYVGTVVVGCICIFGLPGWSQVRAEPPVDFDREIRPILSEHCYPCHGPDQRTRKADLRLDRKNDAFRVREGIAVIVPAKVEESEMIRRVASGDPDEVMPPPNFKKRLNSQQVDRLRRWVAQGAKWEGHWSHSVPARVPAPPVNDQKWPRNPIDHFVLARLEREALRPSP